MKKIIIGIAGVALMLTAYATELNPLPDMSASNVPSAKDAEGIVVRHIMKQPNDGLSAMASISAKTYFSLEHDFGGFGKEGDRIWQVHFVEFSQTKRIAWVNAETKKVQFIYPANRNIEVVPKELGEQIQKNLLPIGTANEYPNGFGTIEDVDFRCISIAGFHSRNGVYDNLLLFPYWNVNIEPNEEPTDWKTGIAFRKNSPIIYSWRLD